MKNIDLLEEFFLVIEKKNYMRELLEDILGLKNLEEHSYICRYERKCNSIYVDLFDNVDDNRFHQIVFSFDDSDETYVSGELGNSFYHNVFVNNIEDSDDKILKLAYLFKIDDSKKLEYANTFLDKKFISCLKEILK